jgi:hypothetical protein
MEKHLTMIKTPDTTIMRLIFITLLTLLLASCTTAPLPTSPTPTENLGGLSSEAATTLRSLEKVDAYPLYVMRYTGAYDFPHIGQTTPQRRSFACSLFATLGASGDRLYGRNFDFPYSPALLLFTDPPDGYASVSMVDLTYLDIDPSNARSLTDLPLVDRTALLAAPSMPFDGMNEYGLTIAMAALPDSFLDDASVDPSKPTIGSIGIIRQVLDHARSVDEAVAIFEQYNIDFSGGPPIHYLIADPGGKAVLIEFNEGKMVQLPNDTPWHLATNHLRYGAQGDGGCPRYRALSEKLTATNGQLDTSSALQLLSQVSQGGTQWSVVYNMTSGDVSVVMGQSYQTTYPFHLNKTAP